MLSPDFLMNLARRIHEGLQSLEQEMLDRAENIEKGADFLAEEPVSPPDLLSGYAGGEGIVDGFARTISRLCSEGGATAEELASRLDCPLPYAQRLGERVLLRPSRELTVALCFALELTPEKAEELLRSAGYELRGGEVYDIVIRHCLEEGVFDLGDVSEALECFNLKGISLQKIGAELSKRYGDLPKNS